tara:strand:+ start:220 stop:384 length:165 start_codon:yes stop_codon:yes gene_type:complete
VEIPLMLFLVVLVVEQLKVAVLELVRQERLIKDMLVVIHHLPHKKLLVVAVLLQ